MKPADGKVFEAFWFKYREPIAVAKDCLYTNGNEAIFSFEFEDKPYWSRFILNL